MIILAIDPGSEQSAWLTYNTDTKEPFQFNITDNCELLQMLERDGDLNDDFDNTDVLVIEMIACYGMPVGRAVFDTCAWIGRFECAFGTRNCKRIFRKDVKIYLCNSMRAKDGNIRQAIIDRYKPTGGGSIPQIGTKEQPGPLYGISKDIWSALGVAITYSETK